MTQWKWESMRIEIKDQHKRTEKNLYFKANDIS